jgi:hypothetical protein
MQISTDLTRGIRQIEIPTLTEARLGPVDTACRFRVKSGAQMLLKSRPDAIVEENGRIVITQIWRGATPAERLVFTAEFTPDADDNTYGSPRASAMSARADRSGLIDPCRPRRSRR